MPADKPTGKTVTHIVGGNYSNIFKIQKCSSWQARLVVDSGLPRLTPRMDNNISSMPIRFLLDPSGLFLLAKECTRPVPAFE